MEFNEKLQQLRKQRELTQEELAQALYVSRTAISKWESGRGYPGIESLKTIAVFFSVTVDDLLSGEELLTLAEEDSRQKKTGLCDLVFGLLDLSAATFLFLPLFGQKVDGTILSASLVTLTAPALWLRILYFAAIISIILWGVLTLTLQNYQGVIWQRSKRATSLILGGTGALLFIISSQPYAAAVMFVFLVIKALVLAKKQ